MGASTELVINDKNKTESASTNRGLLDPSGGKYLGIVACGYEFYCINEPDKCNNNLCGK